LPCSTGLLGCRAERHREKIRRRTSSLGQYESHEYQRHKLGQFFLGPLSRELSWHGRVLRRKHQHANPPISKPPRTAAAPQPSCAASSCASLPCLWSEAAPAVPACPRDHGHLGRRCDKPSIEVADGEDRPVRAPGRRSPACRSRGGRHPRASSEWRDGLTSCRQCGRASNYFCTVR
jgi:hypothetical protein